MREERQEKNLYKIRDEGETHKDAFAWIYPSDGDGDGVYINCDDDLSGPVHDNDINDSDASNNVGGGNENDGQDELVETFENTTSKQNAIHEERQNKEARAKFLHRLSLTKSSVLHISGKPGAGKSTLMEFLYSHK